MSENQKETYELALLGHTISVKTSLSHEEIRQVVVLIEDQVAEIKKQNSNLVPQKLHLLALMAVAEKYIALRSQLDGFKSEIGQEISHLKQYVEQFIQNNIALDPHVIPGTETPPSS